MQASAMRFYRRIGPDTIVPIAFLEEASRVGRSVAFLPREVTPATGVLVTDELLITNNHVFPDAAAAAGLVARFNYQDGIDETRLPHQDYELDPGLYFHTNQTLDYTIVGVRGRPGSQWGHIDLEPRSVEVDDDVFVIQHPDGRPKSIAISGNTVTDVCGTVLRYTADTEIGSSGSPVFDYTLRLVALHHWGGETYNEGILVSAIANDWRSR